MGCDGASPAWAGVTTGHWINVFQNNDNVMLIAISIATGVYLIKEHTAMVREGLSQVA